MYRTHRVWNALAFTAELGCYVVGALMVGGAVVVFAVAVLWVLMTH